MAPLSERWQNSGRHNDCGAVSMAIAKYLRNLAFEGILPNDLRLTHKTFDGLLTLRLPAFQVTKCSESCRDCARDLKLPLAQDLARELRVAVQTIKEKQKTLFCLSCAKPNLAEDAKWDTFALPESWRCAICHSDAKSPVPATSLTLFL